MNAFSIRAILSLSIIAALTAAAYGKTNLRNRKLPVTIVNDPSQNSNIHSFKTSKGNHHRSSEGNEKNSSKNRNDGDTDGNGEESDFEDIDGSGSGDMNTNNTDTESCFRTGASLPKFLCRRLCCSKQPCFTEGSFGLGIC